MSGPTTPEQYGLSYSSRPLLGSFERFIASLIEQQPGAFPLLAAPVAGRRCCRIAIGTCRTRRRSAASSSRPDCARKPTSVRKRSDLRSGEAQHAESPLHAVVGDREADTGSCQCGSGPVADKGASSIEAFHRGPRVTKLHARQVPVTGKSLIAF